MSAAVEKSNACLGSGQTAPSAGALPLEFLADYFQAHKTFSFSEQVFGERYQAMLIYCDPAAGFDLDVVAPLSGFKALVVPEPGSEVAYKFGQRVAALLTTRQKRPALAKAARKLYDWRSKVAHGTEIRDDFGYGTMFSGAGKTRKTTPPYSSAALDAEKTAKAALRKLISIGQPEGLGYVRPFVIFRQVVTSTDA